MATNQLSAFWETFRQQFEAALHAYLAEKIDALRTIDTVGSLGAEVVRDFVTGSGKRIRPALVVLGYQAAGGKDRTRILRPAITMELLHHFFLIHDDIMDRSDVRRNRPTVHRVFERLYRGTLKNIAAVDRQHFTYSMAMLAGDLCCAIAYEALSRSDFPSDRVLAGINEIHRMVDATVTGQALDIIQPLARSADEEAVCKIYLLKTACYTFDGPLRLGLILGGAAAETLAAISDYAIPVGVAFQIQDDLLGVFGTEAELGKSVTADIEEGKQTLLTTFTHQHSPHAQRERMTRLIGKRGLSTDELEAVRTMMRETGAVAYCEQRARELVGQGKRALARCAMPACVRSILSELADYAIQRTT